MGHVTRIGKREKFIFHGNLSG